MLPWIAFIPIGGADLGDLEFIRDKILAGDWWEVQGAINAVTNTISFVPASGKTAFMYTAKIVINDLPNATPTTEDKVRAALKINAVTKDTTNVGTSSFVTTDTAQQGGAGAGWGNLGDGRLDAIGRSLIGDGIKAITIENIQDEGSADASMQGWIQNT